MIFGVCIMTLCAQQSGNPHDRNAVSTLRRGTIVGHVLKKISQLCSLFLERGSLLPTTVTGDRQPSHNLPQGGLQIPCKLTFCGPKKLVETVQKLVVELQLDQLDSVHLGSDSCEEGTTGTTQKHEKTQEQDVFEEGGLGPKPNIMDCASQPEDNSVEPWIRDYINVSRWREAGSRTEVI